MCAVIDCNFTADSFTRFATFRQEVNMVFRPLFGCYIDVVGAEYKVTAIGRSSVHNGDGAQCHNGEDASA